MHYRRLGRSGLKLTVPFFSFTNQYFPSTNMAVAEIVEKIREKTLRAQRSPR
jgi:hypothetical protein